MAASGHRSPPVIELSAVATPVEATLPDNGQKPARIFGSTARALGCRRGFWVAAALLVLFPAAASSPSPLYGVYAARWSFAPVTLTAVFAVYAFALLIALLLFGTVSDTVGRKPVVIAALGLLMGSLGVFAFAQNVAWLYVARIGQGFATGLVTAAASAWLLDLQPAQRQGRAALVNASFSTGGLALGALYSGALVQYAPLPRRLVFFGLLIACGLMALAILLYTDETAAPGERPRPRLHIGVSADERGAFIAVIPCLASSWALAGHYLSLAPGLTLSLGHSSNYLIAATGVAVSCAPGSLACVIANRAPPHRVMVLGCALLVVGVASVTAAIAVQSLSVFFAASVLAGIGFGIAFLGALRTLISLAHPDGRGALVAAIYTVAYLSFSLPAVLAGLVATYAGIRPTQSDTESESSRWP
jgi:MFS family permease